ncbi:MAG TPA: hypothetical protein VFW65_12760 [Pseudonocardiaceae bacterium]|nr:hypothetical protein [Pseudonocardiaceae bacterium]
MAVVALGDSEHGDDLVRPDDLDLADERVDEGLGLSGLVAAEYLVDVGDDLGEFGGFGHGGFAVEFFGEFVAALPELLDLCAELRHAGCGGVLVHRFVLERGEVPLDLGVGLGEFAGDHVAFGDPLGVAGEVELAGVGDGLGDQVGVVGIELAHGGEHGLVGVLGVEARRGAFGGAVAGAGEAGVVAVGLGAAGGGGADHGLVAVGAAQFAGEQVLGGVGGAAGVVLAACGQNPLRHFESLHVDDRLVRVRYHDLAEGDLSDIDPVDQHPQHLVRRPRSTRHGPVAALVQAVGDRTGADAFVGVAAEDRADDRRFLGRDLQHGRVRVRGVPAGAGTACPAATGGFAFHPADHPVDDHFTFELGEHTQQLQQQPAHRGGGVDRLGRGAERDPGLGELVEQVNQVAQAAGEPVHPIHEQHVDQTQARGLECLLQARPVGGGAGGVVGEPLDQPPSGLGGDVGGQAGVLCFDRVGLVFLVGGASLVDTDPHVTGRDDRGGGLLRGPRLTHCRVPLKWRFYVPLRRWKSADHGGAYQVFPGHGPFRRVSPVGVNGGGAARTRHHPAFISLPGRPPNPTPRIGV